MKTDAGLGVSYACLALSMCLVGSYIALTRPLVAILPVFLLAWLRFGIGGLAMARWLRKPRDEPPLDGRTRWLIFLESFLGNFMFTLCMVTGISLTTAVSAGVILSAIPAVVAIFSWVFLKETIQARVWLAAVLGMGGIVILSLVQHQEVQPSSQPAWQAWIGNLLIMLAVMCEASYAVIGKRLTATMSPKRISAVINACSLALMTPFGLYSAWHFEFSTAPAWTWPLLLFYALAASVWTVWLWMTGLRRVPASRAGLFMVLLPLSTAAVGVWILGEPFSLGQLAAFGLAMAGLLLATLPAGSKARA